MIAALLSLVLTQAYDVELNDARRACEKQLSACARYEELKKAAQAEADAEGERRYLRQKAADEKMRAEALEAIAAEERAEEEKQKVMKKKCGKDYRRVRVGMTLKRLRECTGDVFELVAEDLRGAIYEAPGGSVRVEKGVIVKWLAR